MRTVYRKVKSVSVDPRALTLVEKMVLTCLGFRDRSLIELIAYRAALDSMLSTEIHCTTLRQAISYLLARGAIEEVKS